MNFDLPLLLYLWTTLCCTSHKQKHPSPFQEDRDNSPDGTVSHSLGPLQSRHPLVIVAEEGQVQVGAVGMALGADGELAQQSPGRLCLSSIPGIGDGLLEFHVECPGVLIIRDRTDVPGEGVGDGHSEEVRMVLVQFQQLRGGVLKDGLKLRGLHVVDCDQCRLGHGVHGLERDHVLAGVLEQELRPREQLHLPQSQVGQHIKVVEEVDHGVVVLGRGGPLCVTEQPAEQSVFQRAEPLLMEWLDENLLRAPALLLVVLDTAAEHGVVWITEPPDVVEVDKAAVVNAEEVDGLLLCGENSQRGATQGDGLVVGEIDLVALEGARVGHYPRLHVHRVKGVVLQLEATV